MSTHTLRQVTDKGVTFGIDAEVTAMLNNAPDKACVVINVGFDSVEESNHTIKTDSKDDPVYTVTSARERLARIRKALKNKNLSPNDRSNLLAGETKTARLVWDGQLQMLDLDIAKMDVAIEHFKSGWLYKTTKREAGLSLGSGHFSPDLKMENPKLCYGVKVSQLKDLDSLVDDLLENEESTAPKTITRTPIAPVAPAATVGQVTPTNRDNLGIVKT